MIGNLDLRGKAQVTSLQLMYVIYCLSIEFDGQGHIVSLPTFGVFLLNLVSAHLYISSILYAVSREQASKLGRKQHDSSQCFLLYCFLYFSDAHIYLHSISILEPGALLFLSLFSLIYDMINFRLYHCGEVSLAARGAR